VAIKNKEIIRKIENAVIEELEKILELKKANCLKIT